MVLVTGPKCIPRKGLPAHQLVASVMASHEQHRFQTVVIPEEDHFCQWISHDGFTQTVLRSSSAYAHLEAAADGVQEKGRAPHRP